MTFLSRAAENVVASFDRGDWRKYANNLVLSASNVLAQGGVLVCILVKLNCRRLTCASAKLP